MALWRTILLVLLLVSSSLCILLLLHTRIILNIARTRMIRTRLLTLLIRVRRLRRCVININLRILLIIIIIMLLNTRVIPLWVSIISVIHATTRVRLIVLRITLARPRRMIVQVPLNNRIVLFLRMFIVVDSYHQYYYRSSC